MAVQKPAAESHAQDQEWLLVQAAQADPAKFVALYELHFERIYGFIARRVRDRDVAEDLTSEVFHKALANLRKFEWRGDPFAAWLIRIAANAVADYGKRAAREVATSDDPPDPGAAADLEAVEHRARLFRMVERLPADQQRVIVERFVEQRSIRDIAVSLGRSEGAIKQLQFRALKDLREQMEGGHA